MAAECLKWQVKATNGHVPHKVTKSQKETERYNPVDNMGEFTHVWLRYVPPGVYYPSHIHQPLEIYHVFAGSALYTVADEEDIEAVRGGAWPSKVLREVYKEEDFWVHLPYQAHAMETLDQPVLFLWGWVDNLKAVDYSYFEKDIFADQMSFKNETVLEVV